MSSKGQPDLHRGARLVLKDYVNVRSFNRIRISSNCVELIFVKVHLSTLGASRDAVFSFSILLSGKCFDPGGLLQ